MNNILCKKDNCISVIGKMGQGKTSLIANIIKSLALKNIVNSVLVFSATANWSEKGDYGFIPEGFVHSQYDDQTLARYIKCHIDNPKIRGCVVFDDCFGSMNLDSSLIKKLVSNMRHYRLIPIFSFQYFKAIPRWLRSCIWTYCQFKEGSVDICTEIWSQYGGLADKHNFVKQLETLPQYTFMMIDATACEKKDKFAVLKAPVLTPFKLKF